MLYCGELRCAVVRYAVYAGLQWGVLAVEHIAGGIAVSSLWYGMAFCCMLGKLRQGKVG